MRSTKGTRPRRKRPKIQPMKKTRDMALYDQKDSNIMPMTIPSTQQMISLHSMLTGGLGLGFGGVLDVQHYTTD